LSSQDLGARLGQLLKAGEATLSVAETTTGGRISALIVATPGSSAYYDRGVVAYSKQAKTETLGISEADLNRYGAVSEEAAKLLAEAVRELSKTTYGLAETGIAGPIQGRSPKPIGTAHVALAGPGGTQVKTLQLAGDRSGIQEGIAVRAIEWMIEALDSAN